MSLRTTQLFIFDLDGVIYLGDEPIEGAKRILAALEAQGKEIFFLTNNSTRTRVQFKEKLNRMGIPAHVNQIITSAYSTARYLQQKHVGASLYIIGEEGLLNECKNLGFRVYSGESGNTDIDYVVVGLDRSFNFEKLAKALTAIERGAKFIATNDDPTLPTEHGNLPGAGTMVSAVRTGTGVPPEIIIGKPNTFMVDLILKLKMTEPAKAVIIGDRYTTDIKAGLNARVKTVLVKTGVGLQELTQIPQLGPHPDLILESVADIFDYI
jgi:HAD superfamily hydrolase (TIGR01457 family)